MYLEEFYDYKNKVIEDLLTNETLVKLINEEYSLETSGELVYKQVFPYEYIPETIDNGHTYICVDVDISRSYGSALFYDVFLYVWVMSHRSRLRLPEGGVRPDKICNEIVKAVNGSRYYGLGKIELSSTKRFAPLTDYQGKLIVFTASDFNLQNNGKSPIPSNRKA